MPVERRRAKFSNGHSNPNHDDHGDASKPDHRPQKWRLSPVRCVCGLAGTLLALKLGLPTLREPGDEYHREFHHRALANASLDRLSETRAATPALHRGPSPKNDRKDEKIANNQDKKVTGDDGQWKWFGGDLNAYYNSLEEQIHDRDPSKISSYAVHRWMGPGRSTEEHYELVDRAVARHHPSSGSDPLRVFDAGCGLGSALMFLEARHPEWDMTGHTISVAQHQFIKTRLPEHSFRVNLRSYDEIGAGERYDVMYSIEALIHSPDVEKTVRAWAEHVAPGGIVVVIDDYVAEGVDKDDAEVRAFAKSWLANVLITPTEFGRLAEALGLAMVENRDLLEEYDIVKRNYGNHRPDIKPVADRNHQGWMGSKWRQRLTVEGKLLYNMVVLQKKKSNQLAPQ